MGNIKMKLFNILNYIFFFIITAMVIFPLLIVVFTSLKNKTELANSFALALPKNIFNFSNYIKVFKEGNFLLGFKNSFLLVTISVILNSFLSSMVAYCLSRFEFGMKKFYYMVFTVGMLIPTFMLEISRFSVIASLGIYKSPLAPIIIYIGADLMQIYIFKQFIDQIPYSLDESAILDGCTYFGVFFKIIFPTIVPATATLAILKAVDVLNDMYTPYLYMPGNPTLTTILMNNTGRLGDWTLLSAGIVIVMLPNILVYLGFRKYILSGIVAGAVKE